MAVLCTAVVLNASASASPLALIGGDFQYDNGTQTAYRDSLPRLIAWTFGPNGPEPTGVAPVKFRFASGVTSSLKLSPAGILSGSTGQTQSLDLEAYDSAVPSQVVPFHYTVFARPPLTIVLPDTIIFAIGAGGAPLIFPACSIEPYEFLNVTATPTLPYGGPAILDRCSRVLGWYGSPVPGAFATTINAVDRWGQKSSPKRVVILVPPSTLDASGPAQHALAWAPVGAEPAHGEVRWRLELPRASHVRLGIFDAQGRHVRTLIDTDMSQGASVAAWDGRDASGHRVARGRYLARLEAGGEVLTRPAFWLP